jgi:hypothetical protein
LDEEELSADVEPLDEEESSDEADVPESLEVDVPESSEVDVLESSEEVDVPESLEDDVPESFEVDVVVSPAVEPVESVELVCGVELAVEVEPSEPVLAITPKAMAKVASAAAVTRRRMVRTLRARARRRWRTRSEFEAGGGV